MATSGIVKTNVKYGSYFWVKWEIKGSQDIANNRTTIAWSCGLHPEEQYYDNAVKMNAVTINGTKVYSGGTYSDITDYKDRTFDSGTLTIPHNSDGSKNFTISAVSGWIYGNGDYYGEAKSFTLPTIPRASSVSCSTANIGSNATITINRASTSFTHTLTYSFGDLTGTIATKTSSTNISWTIPTTFYGQIPNSKSGTGTITCQTYKGSNLIGSKSTTFTATVSESASKPTLSPTVSDSNSTTTALTGDSSKFIKYYSNAAVATGAQARNSATLKSYKITCGAKSLTTTSGTINAVESGSFTFSATDSRGYTTTQTVNKTLIEYIKLTCSLNAGAPTTAGVATLKISGNYFNGSFGAVANTLTVQYRYKTQGGTYGSWTETTATKSGNTYNATATISGLDYQATYVFQARAVDKLATINTDEQARRTTPIFDWSKNDFKVNGDFRVTGATTLDGNLTGKYLTGTWIQTTAATDLNSTPPKVAVLDGSGWIYSRTPNELKSDMGLSNIFISQSISPKDWKIPANSTRGGEIKGTIKGYEGYTPILTSCYCINSYYVAIINSWLTGSYSSSNNGYTWHIDARNFASSKIAADFAINILWIKTNLFG